MIDIEYDEKQIQAIADQFGKEVVQDMFDRSIKKSITLLQRYAIQETPTDQGRLRNGFQTEFKQSFGRLFNPVNYAVYVHDGTKPHSAPFDKIEGRANRHGLNPGSVRRAIRMKGTKANPFMDRAVDQGEKQVDGIFDEEVQKMVLQLNS